jgi:hypothetical protein
MEVDHDVCQSRPWPSPIKDQRVRSELEIFIKTYLNAEQGFDTSGYLRPTLLAFNESYVDGVRQGLSEVLHNRVLTLDEYERLTDIEFPDEESLHEYLRHMYSYLFEGSPEQPTPPD